MIPASDQPTHSRRGFLGVTAALPLGIVLTCSSTVQGGTTAFSISPELEPLEGVGTLRIWRAARPRAVLGFLPGAGCKAERYDWLSGLVPDGISLCVLDAESGVSIPQFERLVERLRGEGPILLGGHSAGAALVLDALAVGESRNSRLEYPEDYAPPQDLSGVVVLGCSLQPEMLNFVLPHRRSEGRLDRPAGLPLLFISGDHDRIATPEAMERTRQRFDEPTAHSVLIGATHYGFAAGSDPTDNPRADAPGGMSAEVQCEEALARLRAWLPEVLSS